MVSCTHAVREFLPSEEGDDPDPGLAPRRDIVLTAKKRFTLEPVWAASMHKGGGQRHQCQRGGDPPWRRGATCCRLSWQPLTERLLRRATGQARRRHGLLFTPDDAPVVQNPAAQEVKGVAAPLASTRLLRQLLGCGQKLLELSLCSASSSPSWNWWCFLQVGVCSFRFSHFKLECRRIHHFRIPRP